METKLSILVNELCDLFIYILKKVDDYDSIDYLDMVRETGEKDKNGKPTYRLNEEYFTFVEGKSKEDIQQIEKLNDEE